MLPLSLTRPRGAHAPHVASIASIALAIALAPFAAQAAPRAPALDPPAVSVERELEPRRMAASLAGVQVEWTLHTSADGLHPSADEQQMLWLMNRARANPTAEGSFLANLDEDGVGMALGWFQVDLLLLQLEFTLIPAKPPAAFDARLYEGAYAHSLYLIDTNAQNHTGQFDRVAAAGFHHWGIRGNVFSYADTALYAHAGFNVDWGGNDGTGMQPGRGHRVAIMSIDADYPNVGLAVVPESNGSTQVGPLVVTGNYAYAATTYTDHYNRFVVGTVWEDANENGRYDAGEGVGGVEVAPSVGPYFAVTGAAGGYAIPMPENVENGLLSVSFTGATVAPRTEMIDLGSDSALVDYVVTAPEPDAIAMGVAACLASFVLRRRSLRG
jgi:hypothetical protein